MRPETNGLLARICLSSTFAVALVSVAIVSSASDARAQTYVSPYLASAPQESVAPTDNSGRELVLAPGQRLQPYGFLWTGYNANVEYDVYGMRRVHQPSNSLLNGFGLFGNAHCSNDRNNPCGNPDCSNCKSHSRSLISDVIGSFSGSNRCGRCNGNCCKGNCDRCQKRSSNAAPTAVQDESVSRPVDDRNVIRVAPSVSVPVETSDGLNNRVLPKNDLPPIDRTPTSIQPIDRGVDRIPNSVDQFDPRPNPPEPTLDIPVRAEPRLRRNRLPQSDSLNTGSHGEEAPKSSRRSQKSRTLAAVERYIQS